ncbi:MAG TPA: cache domain-containing protein [Geothrix sp.]|nr:cache domain-containing protein [Geothrix sp.]
MTDAPEKSGVSPPARGGGFTKYLAAGVVVLNLVVAAIGWFALNRSREHYNERAAVTAQNMAMILDENLTGIIAKVDIALLAVVDEAERQLAAGPIRPESLNRFIVREHSRVPELVAFRATDASGDAIYGPPAKAVNTISLAHRDYFKFLQETPQAGLVISKPLVGGISGKWMVVLARRINRPDGAFAGLVYTGLALDHLTRDFAKIDIGKRGSITLIDGEGSIVTRYPQDDPVGSLVGQKIASAQLDHILQAKLPAGVYVKKSSIDSQEKTFSFRKLGVPQPYYILVGLATIDHQAAWRSEARVLSSFMVVFLILTIVSALLIHGEWRRNEAETSARRLAQELLMRQKEALEATLARTKRLEGIISICMHCKKINNKRDSWEQIEKYISDNSDALFSHGICPECLEEHFPHLKKSGESGS